MIGLDFELPCDQCEYQQYRKEDLERHEQSVHDGVKYQCVI